MDDKQLIQAVKDKTGMNQTEIAKYLGVHRSFITKVIRQDHPLKAAYRIALEALIQKK